MDKQTVLDLDHLTEIEQTIILNVLLRDAELRNREEERIRCVALSLNIKFKWVCKLNVLIMCIMI